MNNKVNIITENNVVTILEGKALEPKYPVPIRLAGNIDAVGNFLSKRHLNDNKGKDLQLVDPQLAIVSIDLNAMYMLLQLNPQDPFGTEIKSSLEFSDELKKFYINQEKTFNREELIKLLRFTALYFPDKDRYTALLAAYQKLNISANATVKQETDSRGNKDLSFQKTIDSSNIPIEFILHIPIFKGQQPERFRVEICLDATDASVRFWFESVELAELIKIRKYELFQKQLEHCKDFVVIYK